MALAVIGHNHKKIDEKAFAIGIIEG